MRFNNSSNILFNINDHHLGKLLRSGLEEKGNWAIASNHQRKRINSYL